VNRILKIYIYFFFIFSHLSSSDQRSAFVASFTAVPFGVSQEAVFVHTLTNFAFQALQTFFVMPRAD
jgi:hypothetical protein